MERRLRLGAFLHSKYHQDPEKTFSLIPCDLFLAGLKKYGIDLKAVCATVIRHSSMISVSPPLVLEDKGIEFYPLPTWKDTFHLLRILPRKWNSIGKTIRRFISSVDMVWIRTPTPLLGILKQEARRQGKPVVIHVAGNVKDAWMGAKHKGLWKIPVMIASELSHRYYRFHTRNNIVLATGPEVVRLFSGFGRRVYPFVDSLVEVPKKRKMAYNDPLNLIYVGRIVHRKGLPLVFSALRELKKKNIAASFTVVGSGPCKQEFQQKARDLGVDDMLNWKGYVPAGPSLDDEYKKAGVFVLPSQISEGFPRVILEAWSHGLPVVASRIRGMSEIIKNGENGLSFETASPESLVSVMDRLKGDGNLYSRLVESGYNSLSAFSFNKQLLIVANAFEEVSETGHL